LLSSSIRDRHRPVLSAAGEAQAGHFSTMRRKFSIASRTRCFEVPVKDPFRPLISVSRLDNWPMLRWASAANASRVSPDNTTSVETGFGFSGTVLPWSASKKAFRKFTSAVYQKVIGIF
jgi:hypothetical protein